MIMGTIGGILFAIGMCMCMIKEWNAFQQGIIIGVIGIILLLSLIPICKGIK